MLVKLLELGINEQRIEQRLNYLFIMFFVIKKGSEESILRVFRKLMLTNTIKTGKRTN